MKFIEDILSQRELSAFIGVENHSTPYNPLLFNKIWVIPDSLPSKDLMIIPICGLGESYMLSNEKVYCYGRSLWVLFVNSTSFIQNIFLFDTYPQTDDNNYFTDAQIKFLQRTNCKSVVICDIGVYKSRSLINLLNSAIVSLVTYNTTICLATILGYNSRGYTDIEVDKEDSKYQKEYYLRTDLESTVINDRFAFIQINRKFQLPDLFTICSLTKSQVELKLEIIKNQAKSYDAIKTLWDYDFISKSIKSLDKGDSFDFASLETNLKKWGFKGELIDSKWDINFKKICQQIKMSNKNNRGSYVQELIKAIGNNINSTIKYVNSI